MSELSIPAEARPDAIRADRLRSHSGDALLRDPAALYEELSPAVLGYLRSQGAPDPEDVLGDVFVDVVQGLGRFRGDDAALRRWVFSIAHNRLMDEHRRRRRRPVATTADGPDTVERRQPSEDAVLPDPALLQAIAALTPEQRRVIGLRFVADLAIADVARVMRRRPGAVKALQHRALEQLSSNLQS
jgi:RNA polymerase sigma-70 factor (ECF subfamily)